MAQMAPLGEAASLSCDAYCSKSSNLLDTLGPDETLVAARRCRYRCRFVLDRPNVGSGELVTWFHPPAEPTFVVPVLLVW
jgi:hypothetical protein